MTVYVMEVGFVIFSGKGKGGLKGKFAHKNKSGVTRIHHTYTIGQ